MDFLEQNLAVLAKCQPEIARAAARAQPPQGAVVETSRTGLSTLRVGKVRLCSTVDPLDEASRLAGSAPRGPLAVFGFGMGYHLEYLTGRELVVYEPDPGLLRLALSARDQSQVLQTVRLVVDLTQLGELRGWEPFIHRPSARLHPNQAQGFLRRLEQKPKAGPRPARPRVLLVPPLLGGSLPIAYWCAQALTQLGCEVRTVPLDACKPVYDLVRSKLGKFEPERLDQVRRPMVSFFSEAVVLECEAFEPHLVMVMAQAPIDRQAAQKMHKLGSVIAYWFIENYRHMGYFRELGAAYDHFFHIQGPALEAELDRLGINHSFLPMAAHPPCHRPLDLNARDRELYGAELGFMGAGYPNRYQAFTRLAEKGLDFRIWGSGWPGKGPLTGRVALGGRRLASDEVTKVYNACAMVLNLHASPDAGQQAGDSDFVNPRTFEIPACGGFQLVDRAAGLDKFFIAGKELAVFASEAELIEMVRYYRENPELRARIAGAGRRRVLDQHTYYHRMETLLTRCLGPSAQAGDRSQLEDASAWGPEGRAQAVRTMLEQLTPARTAGSPREPFKAAG